MKPEEGIATIALGLGKMVVEGEKTLRFSPRYPQLLPQRSTVEDILENAQRFFYSLKLNNDCPLLGTNDSENLKNVKFQMRKPNRRCMLSSPPISRPNTASGTPCTSRGPGC